MEAVLRVDLKTAALLMFVGWSSVIARFFLRDCKRVFVWAGTTDKGDELVASTTVVEITEGLVPKDNTSKLSNNLYIFSKYSNISIFFAKIFKLFLKVRQISQIYSKLFYKFS